MATEISSTEIYARQREIKLQAELSRLKSQVIEVEQELAVLRLALQGTTNVPDFKDTETNFKAAGTDTSGGPFAGQTLIDAAMEYLKGFHKPVPTGMVCAVLEEGGFKFESGHPTRAVSHALRQRKLRYGDVFNPANGLWGYAPNFTAAQIKKITKKYAGMGGRSAEEHGGATSEGMKQAQARGVRIGAKLKFTEDKAVELLRLIQEGSSIRKACAAIGITYACYAIYKDRGLLTWRQGDPWPPRKPSEGEISESEPAVRPTLRVVQP